MSENENKFRLFSVLVANEYAGTIVLQNAGNDAITAAALASNPTIIETTGLSWYPEPASGYFWTGDKFEKKEA
jgi:hypothetical protein